MRYTAAVQCARFIFVPKDFSAPHIHAGIRKINACDGYLIKVGIGLFYGTSDEFRSQNHVNFAVEIANDESVIEFFVDDYNDHKCSTNK